MVEETKRNETWTSVKYYRIPRDISLKEFIKYHCISEAAFIPEHDAYLTYEEYTIRKYKEYLKSKEVVTVYYKCADDSELEVKKRIEERDPLFDSFIDPEF